MKLGLRARLIGILVLVVVAVVLLLGFGSYFTVARSLRANLVDDAVAQVNLNVSQLATFERLPAGATVDDFETSGLAESYQLRGGVHTYVEFGSGEPFASSLVAQAVPVEISPEMRSIVSAGRVATRWVEIGGNAYLLVGARRLPGGPDFFFLFDASGVSDTLSLLRVGLMVAGSLVTLVAALVAIRVAAGIAAPVRAASDAARVMAAGDLEVRLDEDREDELGMLGAAFNRMAASLSDTVLRLQDSEAQQRRFVQDVSHELRTPLTALVNEAQMLDAQLTSNDPATKRISDLLVADVDRMRRLVLDLLEISRLDAGAGEVSLTDIDVVGLVAAVAARRSKAIPIAVPHPLGRVVSDPRRVEAIVSNLIDNAMTHAAGSGVAVEVARTEDRVAVTVNDRGPGVDAAELPHLFERFYKADRARHGTGSGLGLAIARGHAERLGGSLSARNRAGGGLAVRLELPVTQPLPDGEDGVTSMAQAEGEV